jgi:hypothetical protein
MLTVTCCSKKHSSEVLFRHSLKVYKLQPKMRNTQLLIPRSWILLHKPVPRWSKNHPKFVVPECSLLYFDEPTTGPYPERWAVSIHIYTAPPEVCFQCYVSFHLRLGLPDGPFSSFPIKILYRISHLSKSCYMAFQLSQVTVMNALIFNKVYSISNSSLHSCNKAILTSNHFKINVFICILFSNNFSPHIPFRVKNKISRSYETERS